MNVFKESVRDRVPYNLALFAVLLIGGLAAPPAPGLAMLLVLSLLLVWLSYLSWPALDGRARMLRAAMLALIGVALVQRVFA